MDEISEGYIYNFMRNIKAMSGTTPYFQSKCFLFFGGKRHTHTRLLSSWSIRPTECVVNGDMQILTKSAWDFSSSLEPT